jgi:hypothetical protein
LHIINKSPERFRGENGRDGVAPTREEVAAIVQETLAANPEKFVGRAGNDGRDGTNGLTELEIRAIVIEAMSNAAAANEVWVKCIGVRTALSKAVAEMEARNAAPVVRVLRQVEQILNA